MNPDRANPFPGLRPFGEDEADLFFGRDTHIAALLARLTRQRFLAVTGSSGTGKSSLVFAGIVPRLHRGYRIEGRPSWRVATLRPGNDPMGHLADALLAVREDDGDDASRAVTLDDGEVVRSSEAPPDGRALARELLLTELTRSSEGLVGAVTSMDLEDDENLLVLVDQFEELFRFRTLGANAHQAAASAFVNLLLRASAQADVPVFVMLTMRADFLGECAQFAGLAEALNEGQYLVPMLDRDQRAAAIRGPLGVEGANISNALVQRLLNDADQSAEQLPLLQHVLMRSFDLAKSRPRLEGPPCVDLEHYTVTGGMGKALSQHADEIYVEIGRSLGAEGQRVTEQMFRCLTDPGEHGQGVRRPCKVSEVLEITGTKVETLQPIVEAFTRADRGFLVQQPPGPLGPNTTLDLSHESLMRTWQHLREWTAAEVAFAKQLGALDAAQREYREKKRGLLRKPELPLALRWQHDERPTPASASRYGASLERVVEFLRRSQHAERTRGVLLWTTIVGVVAALSLLGLMLHRESLVAADTAAALEKALDQANFAGLRAKSASAVAAAGGVAKTSPGWAAALLRETPLPAGMRAVWNEGTIDTLRRHSYVALTGHKWAVQSASFSPDGSRILTASHDNTARLWDADSGASILTLRGHFHPVRSASFSPDGARILTASSDNTARLWDANSGTFVLTLQGHTNAVLSASFSPDGSRILTASHDTTARLWDANSGAAILTLQGHTNSVQSASFSPDGARILTASHDNTARLWDANSGASIVTLQGHTHSVLSAAFSSDGSRILTASDDNTARLWDANSGASILTLQGHTHSVLSAAFSSDGSRILTASFDNTARLWDANSGASILTLQGHTNSVQSAAFSPDGSRILTASFDNTARLWDATSGASIVTLQGHTRSVLSASFSLDGSRILTASLDNTACLWDATSLVTLQGHTSRVLFASFSPDGARVLTASSDNTARLWDANSGSAIVTLQGHTNSVLSAAFSPDGSRIFTASFDGVARLWDATSGASIVTLQGRFLPIRSAPFSPDGSRIFTASSDNTARLWDATSGAAILTLQGHTSPVLSAAFSPDGSRILTTSHDNTARLWNANSGAAILILQGHTDSVLSASFSPDSARILTTSHDNTARLWDANSGASILTLEGHPHAVLSASFSPDGAHILTTSHDNIVRLWDAHSGASVVTLKGHTHAILSASFSPDGARILTTSHDNTARLWDAHSGASIVTLQGHTDSVASASFSPDGARILTTSHDHTARLWDAHSGASIVALQGHTSAVLASFSPDGSNILTASHNTAGLWTSEGEPIRFLGHRDLARRSVLHETKNGQKVARVWDETALTWRDARTYLWWASPFVLPERERIDRLFESPEDAKEAYQRSIKTLQACRGHTFEACDAAVNANYPIVTPPE